MTRNDYNRSGILGAKASRQNASAKAHLPIGVGGSSSAVAFNVAARIFQKFERIQGNVSVSHPVIWKLEQKHIQIRQAIIAKLGDIGRLCAVAHGLDEIRITGVYAEKA